MDPILYNMHNCGPILKPKLCAKTPKMKLVWNVLLDHFVSLLNVTTFCKSFLFSLFVCIIGLLRMVTRHGLLGL